MKSLGFGLLVLGLIAAGIAASVYGSGGVGLAIAAPAIAALLFAAWRLPLRISMLAVAAAALTLENPADVPAQGLFRSPLYTLGALLLAHLNVTLPSRALIFSGLDLVLVYLVLIAATRALSASTKSAAAPPSSQWLATCAALVLGCVAAMWAYGMARGDADVASSLWQVQRMVYLPVVFLLFRAAFATGASLQACAGVLIASAVAKSMMAIYVHATVALPPGQTELAYATTHADSMLFADAGCVIVATLAHAELSRRTRALLLATIPLLVAAMVANHRRLVWVELAIGLAVVIALSPSTRRSRALSRASIVASPVALIYAAAGWGSSAGVFAPVQTLRSVVDSSADGSTNWRDWENYDLVYTVRTHPILGTGYGHGYDELVRLPDISASYSLYRYIPHNSILAMWAHGGLLGFSLLSVLFVVAIFLGARTARLAVAPSERAGAISALVVVVVYLVHCYGDMGLGTWTAVFTVAPALAITGRLWANVGGARANATAGRGPR